MSLYILLTISYIAGILTATFKLHSFFLLPLICFCIVSLSVLLITKRGLNRLLIAIFLLLGFIRMSLSLYPAADDLYPYLGRYCEISGIVSTVPDEYDGYCSYVLTAKDVKIGTNNFKSNAKIRITSNFIPGTGSLICVRGFIKEHSDTDNSTESDIGLYYLSQGISYKLHATETEVIKQRSFILSPSFCSEYFKSRIKAAVDRYFQGDEAALVKSVLLGIKSEFSPEFEKTLIKTSAMRFLYPSFLHMFLVLSVCQLLGAFSSRGKKEGIILIFLTLYALFNSSFYTFIRASLLYSIVLIYRRVRGFSHYPDAAATVILIMLLSNPLLIYNGGFVTSALFGIMLYLFNPYLIKRMYFIPSRTLRTALSVSIIGTVCLLPASAFLFGGVSLYTFIFSLLYTPLTILVLFTAPVVLIMCEAFGAAFLSGYILKTVLSLMTAIPKIIELLPGYYTFLQKPDLLTIVISIIFIIVARMYLIGKRDFLFKFCTTAFLLLAISKGVYLLSDIGNMYVYFVNVGQGDGAVIDVKGKDVILIDGGGSSDFDDSYNIGEAVFLPYLTAKGYTKIDLAVVSHFHKDHCEGIIAAIENLDVKYCLMPDTLPDNELRNIIIEACKKYGTQILFGESGDTLKFRSGMTVDIIAPVKNHHPSDENDTSLVLKFNYNDTQMFFGGDITTETEKLLSGRIGNIDILKASHHGSDTSSGVQFIKEISPQYTVFSVGENNMYNHPHKNVTDRFEKADCELLRTDTMGDIMFKCTKDGNIKVDWFKEDSNGS